MGGRVPSLLLEKGLSSFPLMEPDPHLTMHEDAQRGAFPRVQWVYDGDLEAS